MRDHRSPLNHQTNRPAKPVPRPLHPLGAATLFACIAISASCERSKEPGAASAGSQETAVVDPDEIPISSLREVKGLWVREGTTEPFTGRAVERYKGGQIAVQSDYEQGLIQFQATWLKSGTKKSETKFRDGEAYFETRWRSSDGSKKLESELKGGIPHGSHKRWHANGQLGWVGEFYEGKWHGLVEDRDANGNLIIKGRYDKGRLVEDLLTEE